MVRSNKKMTGFAQAMRTGFVATAAASLAVAGLVTPATPAQAFIPLYYLDEDENNSLEIAKFEVTNRNFSDVSETRFGAAVLNDCKYGISLAGCNLRLSLHRGGDHPVVTGDEGVHEMTYSLLPHAGAFSAESVVRPAYELNIPIVAVKGRAACAPFAAVGAPNVIVESVKPAEDGTDAFVLRLYECEGTKAVADVQINVPVSGAVLTNLLEDEKEALAVKDGKLTLAFRPFEIKTVKFIRA